MKLKQLELIQFRNYTNFYQAVTSNKIIFVGDNAQGKTSLLEALNVLAFTKSHKTNKDQDVIQIGSEYAKINGLIDFNDKEVSLSVIVSKTGKKAKYNGIEMERLSEYIGSLNVVFFAPEDLELIKGNPKTRRRFLNVEIGQQSSAYMQALKQYQTILKERNTVLKTLQEKASEDYLLLDVITEQLIDYLTILVEKRTVFLKNIQIDANRYYQLLANSNDQLTIRYVPSLKNAFEKSYRAKYKYDIITGTTNLGAHRDEVEFLINGHEAKTHASQGEQRTYVLAVKLAIIDSIYHATESYPILLLDDVLSELDAQRQNKLFDVIPKEIQTFITTTDLKHIKLEATTHVEIFVIKEGTIKELKQDAKI
ncbi:MAG: DNA replication/repair protein RecF [Candidatus Izimaplasma sp.]|nr:DNA replication/repair protein RecF [Candidatus Izimaplasma bacterium]